MGVVSISGPALLTSSNHILLSETIKAQFTPSPTDAAAAKLPHAPTPLLDHVTSSGLGGGNLASRAHVFKAGVMMRRQGAHPTWLKKKKKHR